MARFRYYITDWLEGNITGTNDPAIADKHAECTECYVVDTLAGEWFAPGGCKIPVEEA